MIANPPRRGQDDREQLARQWPTPPRRDLPEGRHAIFREYLMQEVNERSAALEAPRTRPTRRLNWRLAASTAVLAAGAFTAAVIVPAVTSHNGTSPGHTATTGTKPAGTDAPRLDIETVAYSIKVLPDGYVVVTLHVHDGRLDIKQFVADMARAGVQARVLDCGGTTGGVTAVGVKPELGPIVLKLSPGAFELHREADSANWTCGRS